jgi:glycosyltransferase involved in cell wall biosynthesis
MAEYREHDRVGWESRIPLPREPKVSMVVAAYQRPRQILVCLHSLLVQTHQTFEVIVVHAGPGPEVKQAVLGLDDPRIRYLEAPDNPGDYGNSSREYGTQFATGDWIGQTNDDNYYVPVYFEWMLSELLRNEAQFAYSNMVHSHYQWLPFETYPAPGRIDAGGWICRADIVKATPWRTKGLVTSDGEYAEALAAKCRVVKVPGCLFIHN